MADDRQRRERWLHARISEDLEDALKREARRRRSPVSLVVRNVLETALDLVEDLVEDGMEVARRSQKLAETASRMTAPDPPDLGDVYGWQDVILNRDARCAGCASALGLGDAAYLGLRERPGGPTAFLCPPCVARLRSGVRKNKKTGKEERS
jgi:uncharacterized membrane protein YccC